MDTKPTKPPSTAKLAANRANAQQSTGPRTEEGKARSAQNALKTGVLADTHTIKYIENSGEFASHLERLKASLQPQDPSQESWVLQIATLQWRLQRLARFEAGLFNLALYRAFQIHNDKSPTVERYLSLEDYGEFSSYDVEQHRNFCVALGMEQCVKDGETLALLMRYQTTTERQLHRAEEAMAKLRNEPKKRVQVADAKTTSASENEPTVSRGR